MPYTMLFRRKLRKGATLIERPTWYFRKVIPKPLRLLLGGRSAFVISLRCTDLETAKLRLPVEALKATRAIEAAKLTLARGPEATVQRASERMLADYRKQYPFGVEDRVDDPDEVTEADVFVMELERLDEKLSQRGLDPRTAIEIRAEDPGHPRPLERRRQGPRAAPLRAVRPVASRATAHAQDVAGVPQGA